MVTVGQYENPHDNIMQTFSHYVTITISCNWADWINKINIKYCIRWWHCHGNTCSSLTHYNTSNNEYSWTPTILLCQHCDVLYYIVMSNIVGAIVNDLITHHSSTTASSRCSLWWGTVKMRLGEQNMTLYSISSSTRISSVCVHVRVHA